MKGIVKLLSAAIFVCAAEESSASSILGKIKHSGQQVIAKLRGHTAGRTLVDTAVVLGTETANGAVEEKTRALEQRGMRNTETNIVNLIHLLNQDLNDPNTNPQTRIAYQNALVLLNRILAFLRNHDMPAGEVVTQARTDVEELTMTLENTPRAYQARRLGETLGTREGLIAAPVFIGTTAG
ncbi:MAG: hypothetical protein LBB25_00310 [Holosporaceae bacterium]|jgi:hypothetical protein|nr:hypothetical protein [Holosporaceae bacterium]